MDVELPRHLTEYLSQLDDFIEREIKPLERENDNIRFFDHRRENERTDWANGGVPSKQWLSVRSEAIRRADEAGHFRYGLPKAYGGRDGSNLDIAVIREHLNYKGLGLHNDAASEHAIVGLVPILLSQLLIEFGTKAQQDRMLPGLMSGQKFMAMAITEPNHGSDATHMETVARKEGSEWVINGEKTWNTGVNLADFNVVFARTSGKAGDMTGITAFMVPCHPEPAPGMVVEEYLYTFTMPSDHARVSLKDVRVPDSAVLGEVGEAMKIMTRFINENRIRQAAASLGVAQMSVDESVKYAKKRAPFGKPLAINQAIQFPLVELQARCEMVRALLYKTAAMMDKYGTNTQTDKVSMLNFSANRLCCDALDQAIQTHGGLGYSRNMPFEHLYRHHRRYRITEGADEIQMRRVAGFMFGTMGSKKDAKS